MIPTFDHPRLTCTGKEDCVFKYLFYTDTIDSLCRPEGWGGFKHHAGRDQELPKSSNYRRRGDAGDEAATSA